jgi:hypothetical protein
MDFNSETARRAVHEDRHAGVTLIQNTGKAGGWNP